MRDRSDDDDLHEELSAFLEMAADEKMRQGASRAEAVRAVRRERGSVTTAKEIVRVSRWEWFFETLWQDCRLAARMVRKSPAFSLVAVVTLGLGIGANAVAFGVMSALILHPLSVPDAGSLYALEGARTRVGWQSYPDYRDLRDRNRSFQDLAAFGAASVGFDAGDSPSPVWAVAVTGNYFDVLHIAPYIGRVLHASDEHGPNSAPYIVLSHGFWHSRFQDDPNVVGRVVRLNKHPFTIIGVAPPAFHGTIVFFNPDFFVPLVDEEQLWGTNDLEARGTHSVFQVLGHLRPGVTVAQAESDLDGIGADLEKAYPKDDAHMQFALARPGWYGDYLGPPVRAFMTGLMMLAGLILIAACANLGSLCAARAIDRSREVAVRLALGAGRSRIVRQLLTEALLVSLMGGAVGVTGTVWLLRILSAWRPIPQFPIHVAFAPDPAVYALAVALTIVSGLLFGLVPVRQMRRTTPYEVIKSGSLGVVGRRVTLRDILLVGQVAICAVLVTSSLVAVRGLMRTVHGNFGFIADHALLVRSDLGMSNYRPDQVAPTQRRMIEAVTSIPGVAEVGLIDKPLLGAEGANVSAVFADTTAELRSANVATNAVTFSVSPEYLHAAGTSLVAGRSLLWLDDANAPRVAIVNDRFARAFFGSAADAIGRYFKLRDGTRIQVVGVVGDGKYERLTEQARTAIFLPFLQAPVGSTCLVLRSNRDPAELAAAVRSRMRDIDAGLPLAIRTWYQEMNSVLFPARMAAIALGVLGAMGAILSITGIFGMAAHSVNRRLRELGIRIAVGARRTDVLRTALGRTFRVLAVGSGTGLIAGILASRILGYIVYQATPRDPLVLTGVVLSMLVFGALATWVPAQRALSVDPLILLREQ